MELVFQQFLIIFTFHTFHQGRQVLSPTGQLSKNKKRWPILKDMKQEFVLGK
jgi:hypothetical protein